jgi:hypothetical protein
MNSIINIDKQLKENGFDSEDERLEPHFLHHSFLAQSKKYLISEQQQSLTFRQPYNPTEKT